MSLLRNSWWHKYFSIALLLIAPNFIAVRSEELVIISPHWDGLRQEIKAGFSNWLTSRGYETPTFRFLDVGGGSDIIKYVKAQYQDAPHGIGIDLIWGGGTDPFLALENTNHLIPATLSLEVLNAIPTSILGTPLRGRSNNWLAVNLSAFGILYNKVLVSRLNLPVPETWEILGNPRLFSWVSSADPRKSASAHVVYEIILQAYGWDNGWKILNSIAANTRSFTSSSAQTPQDISIGEVAYGFVIDSYGLQAIDRVGSDKLGFVIPRNLTALSGDGVAMLRGAPHPELASLFIEFLISKSGQTILMAKKNTAGGPTHYELAKMSVRPELYYELGENRSVPFNPFEWKTNFQYDFQLASTRWGLVNDLIGVFLIQENEVLKTTQVQLMKSGNSLATKSNPPLSESVATALLASDEFEKPEVRMNTILNWQNQTKDTNSLLLKLENTPFVLLLFITAIALVNKIRGYLRNRR